MTAPRLVLSSIAILALASCAPDEGGKDERESSPPFGLELAVVDTGNAAEAPAPNVIDLSVDQLRTKLASGDIRLIDVRTDGEVAQGFIPGAEHIAIDEFDPAALDLSEGREIVFYCRSGRRSGRAGDALAAYTGEPAQHLAGGIRAWQEAGEPITLTDS